MPPRIIAAAGLALAGGLATLAIGAGAPAGAQEDFRVTAEQLRINQRIAQAAVRRANENRDRLDALEAKVNAPAPQPPPQPQPKPLDGPGLANDVPPLPGPSLENDMGPPTIFGNAASVDPGGTGRSDATCPPPFVLRMGGYHLPETAVGVVYESLPLHPVSETWHIEFRNDGDSPTTITAYAVCGR